MKLNFTQENLEAYLASLRAQERSQATISKYARDVAAFLRDTRGQEVEKESVIAYKERLTKRYAPASVNSILAAVNGFLAFMDHPGLRVKPLKIQRRAFLPQSRELTQSDYRLLLAAARRQNKERLYLLMETLCATGIRVSELRFITVQAVSRGWAEVACKGKNRGVFLPERLRCVLSEFINRERIPAGPIFITRSGRPMDRSNIWHAMRALCQEAGVAEEKVFPHALRHLFARSYYSLDRDIAHLADLLGHSSMDTTRIYVATTSREQERRVDALGLVL